MQNRDFFIEAGGETLRYIPALNDSAEQVDSLAALLLRHAQGWQEFAADYDPAAAKLQVIDADRRAKQLHDHAD
jgi:ferrochelatase